MKDTKPTNDQPIEPPTLNASDSHEKIIKPQGAIKTEATVLGMSLDLYCIKVLINNQTLCPTAVICLNLLPHA